MRQTIHSLIFILIVAGLGYLLFKPGYVQVKAGLGSKNWPTATGQILRAEINSETDSEDAVIYNFNVVYAYEVAGQQFQNSVVAVRPIKASSTEGLSEYLQKYGKGQTVEVHYDPTNPRTSILEPGTKFASWFLMVLGLLIWLFALGLFWALLKN